jgi:3-phosphoshikimate 1-carboxyvinyltransferase
MRIRVTPNGALAGEISVPGDKSIAHRWLMLAATAAGTCRLEGLPPSLDVRSTAACLSNLTLKARPALDLWSSRPSPPVEGGGSTWNARPTERAHAALEVEGEGRLGLVAPSSPLDCGNSGTSMRLLAGVVAGAPFRSVLTGDESLRRRPMERVAAPLRSMGAQIDTNDGRPPITIDGGPLHGIEFTPPVPSAQLKSAVLLAGLAAEGVTRVVEPVATRDHTERALRALGAPIVLGDGTVEVRPFAHGPFGARVPGDPSSAAFLIAAAAITGSSLTIHDVGLNPTRLRFLEVLARMGVRVDTHVETEELGEPVGSMHVHAGDGLRATRVEADELPSVIDEVPMLAALAATAGGDTWFLAAGELRVKESDRLAAIARGIRSLGGAAADEGDDLVVAGGGLEGGLADAGGDHRMAMSLAVAALGARAASEIDGFEVADVSFPGFAATLRALGADVELAG